MKVSTKKKKKKIRSRDTDSDARVIGSLGSGCSIPFEFKRHAFLVCACVACNSVYDCMRMHLLHLLCSSDACVLHASRHGMVEADWPSLTQLLITLEGEAR